MATGGEDVSLRQGVLLTEKLVLAKTKTDRLQDVRSLNLWGQDLSDVSVLARMPNVEVLSLSVNRISSLRQFADCLKLQELYLRKNEVADLAEVQWLSHLPQLHVLWLSDNACAETPHYRAQVIHLLPHLTKLDNEEVTAADRASTGISLPPTSPAAACAPAAPPSGAASAAAAAPAGSAPAAEQHPLRRNSSGGRGMQPGAAAAPAAACSGGAGGPAAEVALAAPASHGNPPTAAGDRLPLSRTPSGRSGRPPPASQSSSSAADMQEPQRSGSRRGSSRARGASNVLYAVMALLPELDEEALRLVRAEVEQRLAACHAQAPVKPAP